MKPLLYRVCILASCLFLFAPAGCKSTLPVLVGTYSVQENGKLKEIVRVDRNGDKYFIALKDGRKWLTPAEVSRIEEDDLERILGQPVSANVNALGNENVAVVQVRKGWKLGDFECKTGFLLASSLGPIELYRTDLQDSQQDQARNAAAAGLMPQ
jgi:hypothetical protein